MNKKYSFSPIGFIVLMMAVLISLAAVFSFVQAELAEGVTQEQVDAALKDLSQVYGQEVTNQAQAKDICNMDKYLADCAEIGKAHDLFSVEQTAQVNTILDEIKGQVADQIKSCQSIECLVGVAEGLALKISRKDSVLASQIDLTPTIVREKKEIVELAKSAGLTIDQCIEMDPDTASVELLRGCAKLSKENKVRKYVPIEARAQIDTIADSTDRTIKLKEALSSGKYQCGDNTVSGCGNFCLNPGAEARAAGTSAIPEICKGIAAEFFGPQGIRELENSYNRVSGVADYYYKKAQNLVFTTLDGRTLSSPDQIGQYMEEQGKTGNVEAVSKGMDFMVAQGFATQADKDFAVKMVGKFREKGGVNNFDVCVQDPKACRDFINDDFQNDFDVMDQVFDIMRQELGFSPDLCEQGNFDQSIGIKCLEGGKRALPKIQALASQNPEVQFIVEDIKSHLQRGDQLAQKKDQFTRGTFAGPGGCKNERECFTYCSNPANGPECIAFGSKEGLSGFTGDQAVTKYQQYDYSLNRSAIEAEYITKGGPPPTDRGFPPGFPPYGDAIYQPGQPPYGPGPTGYQLYPPPGSGSQYGPSPECLRAITSGDFATAKQVCDTGIGGPGQPPYPTNPPICPASPYVECPAGQYHESFRNSDGCFIDGPCKPIPTYSPYPTYSPDKYGPGGICDNNLTKESCLSYSGCDWLYPPVGGSGYCKVRGYVPYPTGPGTKPQCSDGLDNDNDGQIDYPADSSCYGPDDYDEYYPPPGVSPGPTYSPGPGGSSCSKSLISLLGDGCHQMYTDLSGRQIYCDGPMTKSAKEGDSVTTPGCSSGVGEPGPYPTYSPYPSPGSCPAGHHYHGEQGGFCMNDKEDYSGTCYSADGKTTIKCPSQPTSQCTPPQWWDPAKGYCVGSTSPSPWPSPGIGSCPAGYHYHGESGGFCMNDREDYAGICYTSDGKSTTTCPKPTYTPGPSYTPYPSCPSGQWWDSAMSKCTSIATTYTPAPSCPAGQYWDYGMNKCSTNSCTAGYYWDSATSTCKPNSTYTYTPAPSCPSGQWWDSATNACKSIYPSCPAGQSWDSISGACKSTTSTTYTPYPSYTPYSGYCGDAVCSSGETASSCPSDCGGGTTSYTPYPTTQYTPPPYSPPPSTYSPPPESPPPPPPPTSALYNHSASLHCVGLNRVWDGNYCQPEGFLARAIENTWANFGKLLGF
mgnify:CR=1 FL=1